MKRIHFALGILATLAVSRGEIRWVAPEDGGTPRDPARIERIGPGEFKIRAAFQEGGQSVLRHAVSRVDLICANDSETNSQVVVHLDLSDDGKRSDYDNKPEAGMVLRDFAFVQKPAGTWTQINGSTERWVATLRFEAAPGETKFGLSPWYTYADYLAFVAKLPEHPHLKKELIGKSDGGREHWELTITDASIPAAQKGTIFWQAREHAYESFSSFAMEGLIPYLLSDAAAEFRKRFVIVLHPMTNVDGVAQGHEYRAGYDFPDPRGTATGRLTFDTADRLRPQYAVAWHNWIAPRDRNVVFFTDGENGRASSRAWWRFAQLFPSLQRWDHRWKDEATPPRYNWEGRRPLSEANIHQYAMKKHNTRVWGWEMPWWNLSADDARSLGAAFGNAFLTTIAEIHDQKVSAPEELPAIEIGRWEMREFRAEGKLNVANPFRDAAWVGDFISPSGKTNVVDGFYDGGNNWALRFAPNELGDWRYLLRGEGVAILQRGTFKCVAGESKGSIRVSRENPYTFAFENGAPFFPMGDTCYGLADDSPITPELRVEYIRARRANGFNFVRMHVSSSRYHAGEDPTFWPWGGTQQKPNYDELNPAYFQRLDAIIRELRASGMNVELLLLNFYQSPMKDPRLWTEERNRGWLRHVIARYSAFDNIFLWTLANEYETHPDGAYRLDFPADVEWAKATARWVKARDPFKHLFTVHPVVSASRKGESPRAPFDPPWRIGEFFGDEPAIDVLSQQTASVVDGASWDDQINAWTGDDRNLSKSIRADRRYNKPVLNTEFGYEYLRGGPTEKKQVHHTDKLRRSAWRIVCAGGFISAGFHGTIGHSDVWNRLDPGHHYTFQIRDEGAAAQLGHLAKFFTALPFEKMRPIENLKGELAVGLREDWKTVVVYLPKGGEVGFPEIAGRFEARWFNPRNGEFLAPLIFENRAITAPTRDDWTLLLKAVPPGASR